jgi:hypothetical protein
MFEKAKNTNIQGNIGMGMCIAYLTRMGYIVSVPITDTQPYDLVFDSNGILFKVQVKTSGRLAHSGNYMVKINTTSYNYSKKFNSLSSDFLYVLCANGDQYLIPTGNIIEKTGITLDSRFIKFLIK